MRARGTGKLSMIVRSRPAHAQSELGVGVKDQGIRCGQFEAKSIDGLLRYRSRFDQRSLTHPKVQSGRSKSFSAWIGMATTLGVCHAVETRTTRDRTLIVWVMMVLTTATTRPPQSMTGAPEAP